MVTYQSIKVCSLLMYHATLHRNLPKMGNGKKNLCIYMGMHVHNLVKYQYVEKQRVLFFIIQYCMCYIADDIHLHVKITNLWNVKIDKIGLISVRVFASTSFNFFLQNRFKTKLSPCASTLTLN